MKKRMASARRVSSRPISTHVRQQVFSSAPSDARRVEFRIWLRRNRRAAARMGMPEVLRRYGGNITLSSAYRIAVVEGVRGHRRNLSRYGEFWDAVNWRLPDAVLSVVWGVTRGNLRQRRLRLGVGRPKYHARHHSNSPAYLAAVAREEHLASRFAGPRPH